VTTRSLEHLATLLDLSFVVAGLSRSKNGVASRSYVPAISIHVATRCLANRDARPKAGHDD